MARVEPAKNTPAWHTFEHLCATWEFFAGSTRAINACDEPHIHSEHTVGCHVYHIFKWNENAWHAYAKCFYLGKISPMFTQQNDV